MAKTSTRSAKPKKKNSGRTGTSRKTIIQGAAPGDKAAELLKNPVAREVIAAGVATAVATKTARKSARKAAREEVRELNAGEGGGAQTPAVILASALADLVSDAARRLLGLGRKASNPSEAKTRGQGTGEAKTGGRTTGTSGAGSKAPASAASKATQKARTGGPKASGRGRKPKASKVKK